jgi:hypothetical protein
MRISLQSLELYPPWAGFQQSVNSVLGGDTSKNESSLAQEYEQGRQDV